MHRNLPLGSGIRSPVYNRTKHRGRGTPVMSDHRIEFQLDEIADADGHRVVGPVSLRWEAPGDACVLIGETGSGKSLVAQSILGLLPPDFQARGSVWIKGNRIALENEAALRAQWSTTMALVPQEPFRALDPTMRIRRQLMQVKGSDDRRIDAALNELDLSPSVGKAYPFQLSGGMAQRTLFATALISDASLVVADEPTKGLDEARAAQSLAALRRLRAEGRSVLVITHDLHLARQLDGTTVVMKAGEVVEAAPAQELFANPRNAYSRDLFQADPSNWSNGTAHAKAQSKTVAELRDVSFGYRVEAPLFENLSFTIDAGQVVAVTGPSGIGKTTLGDVLLGLHRATSGAVLWEGIDIAATRGTVPRLRRKYQKLHQDPASVFARHRTIGQHFVDLADVIGGAKLKERLDQLLERMKLSARLMERSVNEISGGEAQRLALMRILMLDPLLIVADEPSSRVDPIVQRDVFELLGSLRDQQNVAIVLISHQPRVVSSFADKVVPLDTSGERA
ncbi:ABC transporter ATP-binding protein [Mesorhizobium sp. CGMCC 1.15528]|uniref:ABC transporter ATP-binding protein n=1 Tax=Mesorhizobium zhangyense TaxID=1776730 RepID=A0A7C9R9Z3_9HYPH|nr:ATP-binding cassette domain-containing protein [Mesorhizobium zhangyense]NGN43881.1 ABC transporter ATP-binding protein [Mesorhizobium zhangyense]